MKRIHTLLTAVCLMALLTFVGCKKDDGYTSSIVITGYDQRACACCGGIQMNFDNNPKPYNGTFYDISDSSVNLGIDNNTTFPIYLRANWRFSNKGCPPGVLITSFKKL